MKYLAFIRHSETVRQAPVPPGFMEKMGEFVQRMRKSGALVDTGGLTESKDGFRIKLAAGKLTVTDGPFTEAKEIIGGWAILAGKTREDVLRVSTEFMDLHRQYWPGFECESEVRLMVEQDMHPSA